MDRGLETRELGADGVSKLHDSALGCPVFAPFALRLWVRGGVSSPCCVVKASPRPCTHAIRGNAGKQAVVKKGRLRCQRCE